MTKVQKILLVAPIIAALGLAIYEARVASVLRGQFKVAQQRSESQPKPTQDAVLASLGKGVGS